jgi:hypothetical protein
MMWIILYVVGGVVALVVLGVLVMWVLGRRVPEEHVASVCLPLSQTPEAAWGVIADVGRHAEWAAGVTRVVRLEDRGGLEAWRQHMGRNSFVLVTTASEPARRLVRTIDDDHKMFSGRWEYELAAAPGGCRVRLTEYGRIPNPVARFMMKTFFDPAMYARKHLVSLAKKFGEAARVE